MKEKKNYVMVHRLIKVKEIELREKEEERQTDKIKVQCEWALTRLKSIISWFVEFMFSFLNKCDALKHWSFKEIIDGWASLE